jgi:transposase-like protein
MITEYSPEFKESMLQKIFFNPDRSVVSFAREANIPGSTVATWVRNYKKKNGKIMGQKKRKKSICSKFCQRGKHPGFNGSNLG